MGDKEQQIQPKRVFANDVDGYSSKHIAKSPTRDELPQRLLECDVDVYNISESATQQQVEEATGDLTDANTDDPGIMKKITEMVGVPKNYDLSPEEQEEEDRKKEEERKQKLTLEAAERKRRTEASLAEMAVQYEEWQKNLSKVKHQEHKLLEAQSLPLRNYLMKYVMPSLTEAMVECSKIKPEDPADFLAEHLLRSSQQE
ncbi:adenylate kinase 7-like [Stegastes partitus]|uniref:Adenylate kinase 7-like n=1 Tax=Stegastes partitus TaxID=144197 RepID=A0A9Y4JVD0_9TELE|nr:PREDICTED: adenylate kinase 7-like [Stegastes partitus]